MPCCGQQRGQFNGPAIPRNAEPAAPRPERYAAAYFEYVGKTALTAIGPVTGARYRFERPGARVAVDPRDRRSLAAVPNLRQVVSFPQAWQG